MTHYCYKSHYHYKCVTCLRELRKTQGGYLRCDITIKPTKGNFMKMFNYVIKRQFYDMHWETTEKWFSCHIISRFDKYLRDQLNEQKLQMRDYKKTWDLGFKQTEGLEIRDQFNFRNLLVVSIKQ